MKEGRNLGGRPKKLKLTLTPEGLNDLLTKIYAETEDLRQKSIMVFNKSIRNMSENTDIALVGKTNAEYLKIAAGASNTKVQLAKIIADHIAKEAKNNEGDVETKSAVIADDTKERIHEMMKKMQEATSASKTTGKLPSGEELSKKFDEIDQKNMDSVTQPIKPKEDKK